MADKKLKEIWVLPTKGHQSYEPNQKIRIPTGIPTKLLETSWVKAQMAPDVRLLVEVPNPEDSNPQEVTDYKKVEVTPLTAAAATQAKSQKEKEEQDDATKKANLAEKEAQEEAAANTPEAVAARENEEAVVEAQKVVDELTTEAKETENTALALEQKASAENASAADKSKATKARNVAAKILETLKEAEADLAGLTEE